MRVVLLLAALAGCVTTPEPTITVAKVIYCDSDPEYGYEWCVVDLSDGRMAGVPTWDVKEGDAVTCEMRGSLTCFKVKQ